MQHFNILTVLSIARNLRKAHPHFVRQIRQSDCGVAATLTCLNLLGENANVLDAETELDQDREGASLENVRQFLSKCTGRTAKALRGSISDLEGLNRPVILHFRQLHFVVLLKSHSSGVLCFDPAVGPVFLPSEDFKVLFSGHYVDPGNGSETSSYPPARGSRAQTATSALLGVAARGLEAALLLIIAAVLFLILNQAALSSLIWVIALSGVIGLSLAGVHISRAWAEFLWFLASAHAAFERVMVPLLHRSDLLGFRGSNELKVARVFRTHFLASRPPKQGSIAFFAGRVGATAGILMSLQPILAVVYLGAAFWVSQIFTLNALQVGRVALDGRRVRYFDAAYRVSRMSPSSHAALLGEALKWITIAVACLEILSGQLQAAGAMFWILFSLQFISQDFKGLGGPSIGNNDITLVGTEAPVRAISEQCENPKIEVLDAAIGSRLFDVSGLTSVFEQKDLTVKEQRGFAAFCAEPALHSLLGSDIQNGVRLRIFGPGHEVSAQDYDVIATQSRCEVLEPSSWMARCLSSCTKTDLPIFLDLKRRLNNEALAEELAQAAPEVAGILTMDRLFLRLKLETE